MDYKFFFYPWYLEPSYELEDINQVIKQETITYFEKIKNDKRFIRTF
jgi:hypothetical protein